MLHEVLQHVGEIVKAVGVLVLFICSGDIVHFLPTVEKRVVSIVLLTQRGFPGTRQVEKLQDGMVWFERFLLLFNSGRDINANAVGKFLQVRRLENLLCPEPQDQQTQTVNGSEIRQLFFGVQVESDSGAIPCFISRLSGERQEGNSLGRRTSV